MIISSILQQILYSLINIKFLLVNVVIVKKIQKQGGGGGSQGLPPVGIWGNAPVENFENLIPRNGDFLCF